MQLLKIGLGALALTGAAAVFLAVRPIKVEATPQRSGASSTVEYCILFGVGQTEPTEWDGSIEASGARILNVRGWREAETDRVDGTSWKLSTRRVALTRGNRNVSRYPALENGVYVRAETTDADASFRVKTTQGEFAFRAADVDLGAPGLYLDGKASVEQVPVSTRLTTSIEEQDYPALARSGDTVYLAYVEFTHGDRSQRWSRQLERKPESFESLRRPAGGDQVLLREYANGVWGRPLPVSEAGQDVYKTAVAADGDGRVWVVWSAQRNGDFDIYARYREDDSWSTVQRVTSAAGPDLTPVAATASDGAVWIAWQGYRGNFETLAARQQGDRFGEEMRVSSSGANDWAPAIAAGPDGEVAVAWDTYDKGDYDVYLRRMRFRGGAVRMEDPQPVAASQRFEARASVTYDSGGRVWVGWEESFRSWGKDFGAYETTGAGLYQDTWVRVRAFEGDRPFEPSDNLERVLDARPASNPLNRLATRAQASGQPQPDPTLIDRRRNSATPYAPNRLGREGYPRLSADESGNVFLNYRTSAGAVWGALGTTWFEHLARFDGESWQGAGVHRRLRRDSRPETGVDHDGTGRAADGRSDRRPFRAGRAAARAECRLPLRPDGVRAVNGRRDRGIEPPGTAARAARRRRL